MPRPPLTDSARRAGAVLGAAIGGKRRELSLSAEELAADAGLHVDTLRQIERGRVANPGVFTVAAVANQLGLTLDDLTREAATAGKDD
jgi:transcriptional regulator with XRE-family HTH domain